MFSSSKVIFAEKALSRTRELSCVHVERANPRADSDKMTGTVGRMKDDVWAYLFSVSKEAQISYGGKVNAVLIGNHGDHLDRWMKMELIFEFLSARSAMSAENEFINLSSNFQNSLRKDSMLFSSFVTKALDLGKTSKSPSASENKMKRSRKVSGSKSP